MHISEKFHSIQKQFYIFLGKGIKIEFQNYGKMFKELKNNYKLAQNLNYNFGFRFKFPFKKTPKQNRSWQLQFIYPLYRTKD